MSAYVTDGDTRAVGMSPSVMLARSCVDGGTWRIRLKITPWVRLVKKKILTHLPRKDCYFCPC